MTHTSRSLTDVSLVQVEAYLVSKAWFTDGGIGSVGTLWHRDGDDLAEVVLPKHPGVRDFHKRFSEALAAISEFEGRPVAEVVADVVRLSPNLIRVRVIGADTAHGTIPINDNEADRLTFRVRAVLRVVHRIYEQTCPLNVGTTARDMSSRGSSALLARSRETG